MKIIYNLLNFNNLKAPKTNIVSGNKKTRGTASIFKLCSASALSLFISNQAIAQTVVTFTYTGAIQTWTVPAGVSSLTIQAIGAQGGFRTGTTPGKGSSMKGTFTATPGQVLSILAGQHPGLTTMYPGGGGGSFVGLGAAFASATPMIVAGGGGASGGFGSFVLGTDAPVTTSGTGPVPGTAGNGAPSNSCGSGAGGFFTSGGNDLFYGFFGASGFRQGGAGGTACCGYTNYQVGGFGGGGAANYVGSCNYTAGSGGGYSGGSAQNGTTNHIGEAGGSFNGGTSQVNTVGLGTGHGTVTITYLACGTPTLMVSNGAICAGNSFTLSASGADTYSYTGGSAIVTPTINTAYTVTGTNTLCALSNTAAITVTVNALPTVTITASSSAICIGSTATLTAVSSAGSYTWNTGSTTSITPTPTITTVYTASATSVAGCIGSSMITVTVNAIPTISVTSGAICSGTSFTVVASGATTYTYSGGSAVVTPTANASYTVTGNAAGCVGTSSAVSTVTVNTSPTISASASSTVICAGEATTLSATASSTTYTWNTGATTASLSVSPTTTTNYTVTTTGTNGCTGTANVNVTVNACTGINEITASLISVYPNPNNGIVNITLTSALAQNSTLEIYDALGKLVVKQVLANELNAVNMSNLDNGIYVFKVSNNNNTVKIGKLIKQ